MRKLSARRSLPRADTGLFASEEEEEDDDENEEEEDGRKGARGKKMSNEAHNNSTSTATSSTTATSSSDGERKNLGGERANPSDKSGLGHSDWAKEGRHGHAVCHCCWTHGVVPYDNDSEEAAKDGVSGGKRDHYGVGGASVTRHSITIRSYRTDWGRYY